MIEITFYVTNTNFKALSEIFRYIPKILISLLRQKIQDFVEFFNLVVIYPWRNIEMEDFLFFMIIIIVVVFVFPSCISGLIYCIIYYFHKANQNVVAASSKNKFIFQMIYICYLRMFCIVKLLSRTHPSWFSLFSIYF